MNSFNGESSMSMQLIRNILQEW